MSVGEVAPGGHGARCVAGSRLRGVLGEAGVVDVVQGLDRPRSRTRRVRWAGMACSAVGLVPLAGAPALDPNGMAGSGGIRLLTVAALIRRTSDVVGVFVLGMHGAAGDHESGQVGHGGQQRHSSWTRLANSPKRYRTFCATSPARALRTGVRPARGHPAVHRIRGIQRHRRDSRHANLAATSRTERTRHRGRREPDQHAETTRLVTWMYRATLLGPLWNPKNLNTNIPYTIG